MSEMWVPTRLLAVCQDLPELIQQCLQLWCLLCQSTCKMVSCVVQVIQEAHGPVLVSKILFNFYLPVIDKISGIWIQLQDLLAPLFHPGPWESMQSHPKKALNSLAWMYSKHVLAGLSGDSKLAIDVKVSISPLTGDLMNGWMDG